MKHIITTVVTILVFLSCNTKSHDSTPKTVSYAQGFDIADGDGYKVLTIHNPWEKEAELQTYILVPRDSTLPINLPSGTIVRTPIQNSVVYSSVHGGIISEMGAENAISGICDAEYFNMPSIQEGLRIGRVKNMGSSMSPSSEKIIDLAPDAILLTPFQNAGYGTIATLGIPIIECADYMEHTPLGRAEWIKAIGVLYGKEDKADSIFNDVREKYENIKKSLPSDSKRPTVITETVVSGVWYLPGGDSYMAHLIDDAGGDYPWKSDKSSGSLSFDFTQVLDKAQNADFWLIKTFGSDLTVKGLKDIYPLNDKFSAVAKGGVYSCNTSSTTLFADFPFHPELLLREYMAIFHPEIRGDYQLKYFKQVTQ